MYPPLSPIRPLIVDREKMSLLAATLAALPPGMSSVAYEAFLEKLLPSLAWKERYISRMPLALAPSDSPPLRRYVRLVRMVHHLHTMGYQRIRAIPQESPSGAYWRLNITHAGNIAEDGYSLADFDLEGEVALYTTGQEDRFFGWEDGSGKSARQLALLFLERFPVIGQKGQGRDWLYAGWFTDFLGRVENAEQLGMLTFVADYPLDPTGIDEWLPPPPRQFG